MHSKNKVLKGKTKPTMTAELLISDSKISSIAPS